MLFECGDDVDGGSKGSLYTPMSLQSMPLIFPILHLLPGQVDIISKSHPAGVSNSHLSFKSESGAHK